MKKYKVDFNERLEYEADFFKARLIKIKDEINLNIHDDRIDAVRNFSLNLGIDVNNKVILDCGCGTGELSVVLALLGATVFAIDICEENIKITVERAKVNNVENRVKAFVMPVEKLTFDDGTFDFVVGEFVLHHVDVESTGKEIFRVMRVGGKAVFHENTDNNKIIILFRWLLPKAYRLRDNLEYPLRKEEIATLKTIFNGRLSVYSPSFHFFQLLDILFKRRYILISKFISKIDSFLAKGFPLLKRYSYYHVLLMEKNRLNNSATTPITIDI